MRKTVFPVILVIIALTLAFLNYTPGTVLSGWDTLHPEFNLGLYLQRIFWGVWQQHQGLGALSVQAQSSEIGRLWYLGVPFRYGYFWLTLIIGPLGVYKLLDGKIKGFLGGLFYLLNLGTMQHFYLPLEMFVTAYAFLPWLFWAVSQKKVRSLILLFILSAPMAHTPTLWVVNFTALVIFAFFLDKKWSIKVLFIGLIVNSFWLLPTFYYVLTRGGEVANSHISQQFSQRAITTSKEFGNMFDIALIRGYLFDWGHFDFSTRQFVDLFPVWKNHLANPWVLAVGYGSFAVAIMGLIISFWKKISQGIAILPIFLISIIGIMAFIDTEVLRFPFTKFSLLLMLCLSIYFGIAVEKIKKVWFIVAALLVFYMWPAFNGNLICNCERVKIPAEYRQTFDWFQSQDPNTRIAPFPVDSIYGWGYYDWGYEGAGFRWFGLPQALLDREFDRWMPTNENYFWEISQAVYSKNLPLFESVLNKYRVNWLLVDENIINPISPKALYTKELEEMISNSQNIRLVQQFANIRIYSFTLRVPTKSFISVAQNLPSVGPAYKWSNLDQGYFDVGDYQEGKNNFYFFRTLFTGKTQEDLEFDIEKLPRENKIDTKNYSTLSHRDSYLVIAKTKSEGRNLFWVEDLNSRRAVLETYITKNTGYFIVPPTEPDGLGYIFHLDNQESLDVYKIDYWGLITQKNNNFPSKTIYSNNFSVYHPNPAFYKIELNSPGTIILSQSYDPGWVAIGATNHQIINDWANGWEIKEGTNTVYLFFWPQILEFVGFGLLTIFVIGWIIRSRFTSCSHPL